MAEKGGYNPYENRNVDSPVSNFGAFVTLMNCVIGTGVLALPVAFHYAGIINGIVLLILCAFMLIEGIKLLISSMVECSRRMQVGYATYPESLVYSFRQGPDCFKSFAKAGGYIVDVVLVLSHYSTCLGYIVFLASALKQIVGYYYMEGALDVRIYVMLIGLCSLPIFLIQSLKWLMPFNMLADIFAYSCFLVMSYYLVTDLPLLSERSIIFGDIKNMGYFLGIALFSVSSPGVMLIIEAKMAKPQDFHRWFGILDLTIYVVVVSYILFGCIGYWRYGDKVEASVFRNLPTNEPISEASNILMAGSVFLAFPLSGFVVIDIIMNHYWNQYGLLRRAKRKETIVRMVFVVLTTVNGVLTPNLGPIHYLIGAISVSLLNIIFPALMEFCLHYPPEYNYGRYKCLLVKDLTLVVIGSIILIEGSVFALVNMVEQYSGSRKTMIHQHTG